ncbi:MAG: gliding motility-associated C-terminal domain-containing protein, partial [Saprospiraceae bacterium]
GTPPYQLSVDRQIKLFKDNYEQILIGNHILELQDSNGCEIQSNFTLDPPLIGQVELNPDSLSVILGDSVYLQLHTLDIDSIARIEWTGPGTISCKSCLRTSVFINTAGGWFRAKITDVNGCIYEESIWISSKQIYNVPNVFSPNGDNINDYFNIFTDRSIENIELLQIFDRWGDLVYKSRNFKPNGIDGAWNGEVNGQKALPGVYVYLFLFSDKTGKHFKASGNITLLR